MIVAAKTDVPLKTIEDRLTEYGPAVQQRLEARFLAAGLSYPPQHLVFIGIKKDRVLQVYASNTENEFRFVCTYPILAASGTLGPKLREGDLQVPEGIYRVRELNPNSFYHLSIWIDYPNEFDLARAAEENRTEPGSEIMIHGSEHSRGCLAMGDEVSEDLFVLTALAGIENTTIILTPIDFRKDSLGEIPEGAPAWTRNIYEQLKAELAKLKSATDEHG
ncbi:MAG: L,D-transpeptidase family protein [Verrucomicrobiota bacterium]|nr:L,D-transpeptidase family protein [Verrucomicrobiota bacterium]